MVFHAMLYFSAHTFFSAEQVFLCVHTPTCRFKQLQLIAVMHILLKMLCVEIRVDVQVANKIPTFCHFRNPSLKLQYFAEKSYDRMFYSLSALVKCPL